MSRSTLMDGAALPQNLLVSISRRCTLYEGAHFVGPLTTELNWHSNCSVYCLTRFKSCACTLSQNLCVAI